MAAGDKTIGFRFLREAQEDGQDWPWFMEHYRDAAQDLLDFLAGDGLSLEGRTVADIGCGDGILDLGLHHLGRPARLVGFDLEATDTVALLEEARAVGVLDTGLPAGLEFRVNGSTSLPAPDAAFDVVVTWSTFEHVAEPVGLLREIRRILRPDGFMFLQIWPLYRSEHGSHLWPWYPEGYAQFLHDDGAIEQHLRQAEPDRPHDVDFVLSELRNLNGITVDKLQRAMLAADLYVTKFELLTGATRIPPGLARLPLSDLGIAGIKLIAVPGRP